MALLAERASKSPVVAATVILNAGEVAGADYAFPLDLTRNSRPARAEG